MSTTGRFLSRIWFFAYLVFWLTNRQINPTIIKIGRIVFVLVSAAYAALLALAVGRVTGALYALVTVWDFALSPLAFYLGLCHLPFDPILLEGLAIQSIDTGQLGWAMVAISATTIFACYCCYYGPTTIAAMVYHLHTAVTGKGTQR